MNIPEVRVGEDRPDGDLPTQDRIPAHEGLPHGSFADALEDLKPAYACGKAQPATPSG